MTTTMETLCFQSCANEIKLGRTLPKQLLGQLGQWVHMGPKPNWGHWAQGPEPEWAQWAQTSTRPKQVPAHLSWAQWAQLPGARAGLLKETNREVLLGC